MIQEMSLTHSAFGAVNERIQTVFRAERRFAEGECNGWMVHNQLRAELLL